MNYATPDMVVGKSGRCDGLLGAKANSDEILDKQVFVIDTLKKTANMIDKDRLKKVTHRSSASSPAEGPAHALGPYQQHKNHEGDFVFEEYQDLRADVDEMIFSHSA